MKLVPPPLTQILNYHPHVQAQYAAHTGRLSAFTSQFDMNNEDVRRQFMLAEQLSAGVPRNAIGNWKQPQAEPLLGHHHPGLLHQQHQQLPAYRPMADPTLHEHQVQDALAMYHQHGVNGAAMDYYFATNAAAMGQDHTAHHAAAVAAAAAAMAAASGLFPEPSMAFC